MAKSVRALLDTVVQALPEVGNLGLLFFLLFFIFAALGVELFGRVGKLSAVLCVGYMYMHSKVSLPSLSFKTYIIYIYIYISKNFNHYISLTTFISYLTFYPFLFVFLLLLFLV